MRQTDIGYVIDYESECSADILVLDEKVSWKEAKNILWRREINKVSSKGQYKEIESPLKRFKTALYGILHNHPIF